MPEEKNHLVLSWNQTQVLLRHKRPLWPLDHATSGNAMKNIAVALKCSERRLQKLRGLFNSRTFIVRAFLVVSLVTSEHYKSDKDVFLSFPLLFGFLPKNLPLFIQFPWIQFKIWIEKNKIWVLYYVFVYILVFIQVFKVVLQSVFKRYLRNENILPCIVLSQFLVKNLKQKLLLRNRMCKKFEHHSCAIGILRVLMGYSTPRSFITMNGWLNRAGTELWNSQALGQCKMAPPVQQEPSLEHPLSGA